MTEPDQSDLEPSFEEALGQLDQIVESLERGEPELTSALAKFETGVRLLTQCYRLLDNAEQSVALLTGVDQHGKPVTVPFDASATFTSEASSAKITSIDIGPDVGRRKSPERPSTRKPRPAPPSDNSNGDPPF